MVQYTRKSLVFLSIFKEHWKREIYQQRLWTLQYVLSNAIFDFILHTFYFSYRTQFQVVIIARILKAFAIFFFYCSKTKLRQLQIRFILFEIKCTTSYFAFCASRILTLFLGTFFFFFLLLSYFFSKCVRNKRIWNVNVYFHII